MTGSNVYKVVLDVMGADSGILTILQGGIDAALKLGNKIHVTFVGRQEEIEECLKAIDEPPANISFVHAPDEVSMNISASDGVRMRNSSISIGLRMLKNKEADVFVSPGNTGAVMGTALLTLGRIEGVSRPAITAMFPSTTGKPTVVLDVGANADCKPQHLAQFAVMGAVYTSLVMRNEYPRVGLLSIGEERSKGNELILGAFNKLKDSHINFVGNVEGRDILSGTVDVVITDGFTGNIILKFAESIKPLLVKSIQRQIQTNIFSRVGAMLLLPFLRRMKNTFDYAESGGAPLLGVNGVVIICHGSSNSKAICNGIIAGFRMASNQVIERIHEELINNHFGQSNGKNKSQDNRNGVIYSSAADD